MALMDKYLHQTCTYWVPSTLGADGSKNFATPVAIKCRWEERTEIVKKSLGVEVISHATVYLKQDVEEEGYLYLGTSTTADPQTVNGAKEIISFSKFGDIQAKNFVRKCWLINR